MKPFIALAGALLLTVLFLADAGAQQTPAPGPRPPAPAGRGGATAAPSPTETPAPPQFSTLDGVWEVEMQSRSTTYYTHFQLHQSGAQGADISGVWDQGGKPAKKFPLTGSFDGRLFKFTAGSGDKQTTFTGYVENYSDIVGMASDGKNDLPFTAQHRKREKLLQSVQPGI